MVLRTVFASLALGLVPVIPAFAASYHVQQSASASVHMSTDGEGTMIRSEEVTIDGQTYRSQITCSKSSGGNMNCDADASTNNDDARSFLRVDTDEEEERDDEEEREDEDDEDEKKDERRRVLADIEEELEELITRMEERLRARVCGWFEDEDFEACMDDSENGKGNTMRLRLRSWIERHLD